MNLILLSLVAMADFSPKCFNQAVEVAVTKNAKTFDVSTASCGTKALHIGNQAESYAVCTTDETEGMEWIVVLDRQNCKTKYVEVLSDSYTSNYSEEEGAIKQAQECEIDPSFEGGKIKCYPSVFK